MQSIFAFGTLAEEPKPGKAIIGEPILPPSFAVPCAANATLGFRSLNEAGGANRFFENASPALRKVDFFQPSGGTISCAAESALCDKGWFYSKAWAGAGRSGRR